MNLPDVESCCAVIRTAVYGREVREAIWKGLLYCREGFDDAVAAANRANTAANNANQAAQDATAAIAAAMQGRDPGDFVLPIANGGTGGSTVTNLVNKVVNGLAGLTIPEPNSGPITKLRQQVLGIQQGKIVVDITPSGEHGGKAWIPAPITYKAGGNDYLYDLVAWGASEFFIPLWSRENYESLFNYTFTKTGGQWNTPSDVFVFTNGNTTANPLRLIATGFVTADPSGMVFSNDKLPIFGVYAEPNNADGNDMINGQIQLNYARFYNTAIAHDDIMTILTPLEDE